MRKKTFSKKIIIQIFFTIGIITVAAGLSYFLTIRAINSNMEKIASSAVQTYAQEIEYRLDNVSADLNQVLYRSEVLSDLGDKSDADKYYVSINLVDILEQNLLYPNDADFLYIWNPTDDYILFRGRQNVSSIEVGSAETELRNSDMDIYTDAKNTWALVDFGKNCCFMKYCRIADYYVGAIILADPLLKEFSANTVTFKQSYILMDTDESLISDTKGLDIPMKNNKPELNDSGHFLITAVNLAEYKMKLVGVGTKSLELYQMSPAQWSLIALLLAGLVSLLYLLMNYRKQIFEEEIEKQKAELRYLQMQIRPHFYQNALTTIHSLSYQNRDEDIRKFTEALSNHLRYTIRENINQVTVAEEMERVRDYVTMQEIRFKDSVFFMPSVSDDACDCLIPQFLLLTFVENAFKHAMSLDKLLSIYMKAETTEGRLHLMIEDTGDGYPADVIEKINHDNFSKKKKKSETGIENIKRTLKLQYGKDVTFSLMNGELGGAHADIYMPAVKGMPEDDNSDC